MYWSKCLSAWSRPADMFITLGQDQPRTNEMCSVTACSPESGVLSFVVFEGIRDNRPMLAGNKHVPRAIRMICLALLVQGLNHCLNLLLITSTCFDPMTHIRFAAFAYSYSYCILILILLPILMIPLLLLLLLLPLTTATFGTPCKKHGRTDIFVC